MSSKLRIYPGHIFAALLILALAVMDRSVDDWGTLSNGFGNLISFFHERLWPADWSVLEPRGWPECTAPDALDFTCSTAWIGMVETLQIAFVSTILAMTISLPMALLAARNIGTFRTSVIIRLILAAFRSLPSLIWAIFFVILIGLGTVSGIFAMTIYSVGYLGKLQYEAIEGMNSLPLEAADAAGLSRFEKAIHVAIPESANDLISQAIFMFEYNVRHGSIIGIVGAGGIGYYIDRSLHFLAYDEVLAYLIIIFVVVIVIDFISA
ncbi:MAG TPA: ABC transporter permease subunit, partial [Candidatus Poseidoniales archaeon]